MAYFAELDENNVVVQVLAISNDVVPDPAPNDEAGNQFLASLGITGRWLQTSYNANIRGKFAGIGDTYDEVNDIFVTPANDIIWPHTDTGRPPE